MKKAHKKLPKEENGVLSKVNDNPEETKKKNSSGKEEVNDNDEGILSEINGDPDQ